MNAAESFPRPAPSAALLSLGKPATWLFLGFFALLGAGAGWFASHSALVSGGLSSTGSALSYLGVGDRGGEYDLSELLYFRRMAERINSEYVDPARIEPRDMLEGSLRAVERLVPEVLFDLPEGDGVIHVLVGGYEQDVPVGPLESLADLTTAVAGVATVIEQHMVSDIEQPRIEYALMNGALRKLDPHSIYIEPEDYEEMKIQNQGHFSGLGITIGIRDRRLTVLYPLADTPAWRAGIKPGDHIDKIGNESTVNMDLHDAVSRLRGKAGTQVTITLSDDEGEEREVTLTRARIDVPSVRYAYAGDGVGYVQVLHFAQDTAGLIDAALSEISKQAIADKQGDIRGLIMDLRGNPGGYLAQALEVSDRFLREGTLVVQTGVAGQHREQTEAHRFGTEGELPVVVLVNGGSASASEIVAGAMKYNDRAVVMGVRTFGKGSVQFLHDENFNGGALKLTTAQYLTAGDRSIQGEGIEPDIELRPARLRDEDGDPDVRMYWQDFEVREEDLDDAFAWGKVDDLQGTLSVVYPCPECFESDLDRDSEPTAADKLDDPQVLAARELILKAPYAKRSRMLAEAPGVLKGFFTGQEEALSAGLAEQGIDWSTGPASKTSPKLTTHLEVGSEDGLLEPGRKARVTLSVTNDGAEPLYQLRAVTEGDFFHGREFFFGKLAPGETRSFGLDVTPWLWLTSRTEEVTFHFFTDHDEVQPTPFKGRLQVRDIPHPRFAFSYRIVDDGSGTSQGNGDGLLQAGEELDVVVDVKNIGAGSTSDLWRAERGLLSAKDDEDGDGVADKPGATALLRNNSGDALFLVEGAQSFSLKPGESHQVRLHMRIAENLVRKEPLKFEIVVQDERFFEVVSSEIELPLSSAGGEPRAPKVKQVQPKSGEVAVRSGASEDAAVFAALQGPATATAVLGEWLQVELPGGEKGWVPQGSMVRAGRSDAGPRVRPVLSYSPPVIALANHPGGSVVATPELLLEGSVADDKQVKDLYVFVGGQKRAYRQLGDGAEGEFSLSLPLEPGENQVEIYARDDQDLQDSVVFSVYREATPAEVTQ